MFALFTDLSISAAESGSLAAKMDKKKRNYKRKKQTAKKTRNAVDESSKSSDVAAVKTDTNEYKKRKSLRTKPQISYAEGGRDGDLVIPPNKKTKSGRESGVSSASSQASRGKAKKNVNSGNEDILLANNKESEACDGNRENVASSSKIDRVEIGYKSNENPRKLDIPDQEFNVFEVEQKTENFAANQVWSTIDSRDGMPRKYAQVKKVLNAEFKLRITYLEPVHDKNHTSIPVACGKFKIGKTEEVEDRSIFSGLMHHLSCNRIVSIYPRKGEIWALFRDWNENWNNGLEKHQLPYKYDFVEIVSDFHDVNGLGVAYLGNIKGSVSLFHREAQNGISQFQNSPDEMHRFSHKVPAVKMIGKEKECVPADSYKLDPAVLPKDTCQQNAAETEPINDDTLLQNEFSVLIRDQVSNLLKAAPNPTEFILEQVQAYISEELGLQNSVLGIFLLFFEELIKLQRSDDPQLQDKATQVATLWKGYISIKAPKSSLEALAFLLFIVAFGLKKLINKEEAVLLASAIAHYEQAPKIFDSLSLNSEIRKFVKGLIKNSQYIQAVRLICQFKLSEDEEFSPSHLITKEINNLRRSALEMGSAESSQAKDEDAGKLRAILQLVADYKLEINLPGYLIAKLMI